ncbi:DUF6394 family protein [Gammaproteobacteria bacterium]|nr:DUF6394 family protein [Gammaproteobacteria bacterium]
MSKEKVLFAFFIILALTLNFGFFVGDIDNPAHHDAYELFAALVVSLIATIIKFGDRSAVGSLLIASSLVADVHLIAATILWGVGSNDAQTIASVVSLSGGALMANLVSVVLLLMEATNQRR